MIHDSQQSWCRFAYVATLTYGFVLCVEPGVAQEDGRVTIDASRCADIGSPDERLACFEKLVDEAEKQPALASPSVAAAAATSAASVQPQEREEAASPTEWIGTISALDERIPYRHLITLDTGQVWEQSVNGRYALRVGQRVRIYQTRWGRYFRLEADGLNGFIQVDRVR